MTFSLPYAVELNHTEYADQSAADEFDNVEMGVALSQALSSLTETESNVVRARFGLSTGRPTPRDIVAKQFGMSRNEVKNIETRAVNKLRTLLATQ